MLRYCQWHIQSRKKILILTAWFMMAFQFFTTSAYAYYDDTHYVFTYYLARITGFTPLQSCRIASACVSIDHEENVDTEPVQKESVPGLDYLADKVTAEPAQRIRIKYHAMMDQLTYPLCALNPIYPYGSILEERLARKVRVDIKKALAKIEANGDSLLRTSLATMYNPGVYLHYLQDYYAHRGYGSRLGHWDWKMNDQNFAFGTLTDYLTFEPSKKYPNMVKYYHFPKERNKEMMIETLKVLKAVYDAGVAGMKNTAQINPKSIQISPAVMDKCLNVLVQLQKVNPHPTVKFAVPPDFQKAVNEVNKALTEPRDGQKHFDTLPKCIRYPFHTEQAGGDIQVDERLRDDITLYGDLTIVLPQGCPTGTNVTVQSAQTYVSEKQKVLFSTPTRGNEEAINFSGCPVGGVIVEYKTPQGDSQQYAYTLTRQKNTCKLPAVQMRLVRDTSNIKDPGLFLAIRMGSAGIPNPGLPTFYPDAPDLEFSVDAIYEELEQQEEAEGRISVAGLLLMQAAHEALQRSGYHPKELQRYQEQARQIQVTVGDAPLPVARVIVQPPPLDLSVTLNKDKPPLELGEVPPEAAAQVQAIQAAYATWVPTLPHQTELICKLPPVLEGMEGAIVVRYGKNVWHIGWINRYDVPVFYAEGLSQESSPNQPFNPWAVRLQGAGTLTVNFLQIKPLSTDRPLKLVPLGEDLNAAGGNRIVQEAIGAFFTPNALTVSGSLTRQDAQIQYKLGQKYPRLQTSASFHYVDEEMTEEDDQNETQARAIRFSAGPLKFGTIIETTIPRMPPAGDSGMNNQEQSERDLACFLDGLITPSLGLSAKTVKQEASSSSPNGGTFQLSWQATMPKFR